MVNFKKLVSVIAVLLVLVFSIPQDCQAQTWLQLRVEQYQINMPSIKVWVYPQDEQDLIMDDFKPDKIEGFLNDGELTFESFDQIQDKQEGSAFFVLLDTSGSMPSDAFIELKQGLKSWKNSMNVNDKLILITFGSEVTVTLNGSESIEESSTKIDAIENSDQTTHFFDSVQKAISLAKTAGEAYPQRKVLIAITDGIDNFTGNTQGEILLSLKENNMPLYAIGLGDNKEYMNILGEFARSSSGEFYPATAVNTVSTMDTLMSRLHQCYVVSMSASNNIVSNREGQLNLQISFEDNKTNLDIPVVLTKWTPDVVSPSVLSLAASSSSELTFAFSEPVTNADSPSSYLVRNSLGKVQVVKAASYKSDVMTSVVLLDGNLAAGKYSVELVNIKDVSMETNSVVTKDLSFEIEETNVLVKFWTSYMWYILAGLLVLVCFITLLIIILVRKRLRRLAAVSEAEGLNPNKNRVVNESVHIPDTKGQRIEISISDRKGIQKLVKVIIQDSFIIGRSESQCDLSIEDGQLSRQHCALIWQENRLFIQDLGSTNGTSVNGVKIVDKRPLNSGDIIMIGNVKLMVSLPSAETND